MLPVTAHHSREGREASQVSGRAWVILSISVIIIAAIFRLYDPGLKPLHHDEGVNGLFLARLFREGVYRYDPANYHGPTLYYFSLLPTLFFGLNTFAIRATTAMFGVATVWLLLCLRRYIGATGALVASALVAVSPGAVYYSRYFIHETLFIFFTLAAVVALLMYRDGARPLYLMIASISAALLFATKETAIISAAVLIIAWASTRIYFRIGKAPPEEAGEREQSRSVNSIFMAFVLFVAVFTLFYTSFLTNPNGLSDALKTFEFWARTGSQNHTREWHTYLWWLVQEEGLLLALGAMGAALALWRANNRFAVFAALWAFGLLAAYSLIPYKTPWLALNFIIPLAISAGYSVSVVCERSRLIAVAAFCAAAIVGVYQAVALNFIHYDDDRYIYAYAHTSRELLSMVSEIERMAQSAGTGTGTEVAILSPDYWPLPWYLRNYRSAGYYGRIKQAKEAIVIASDAQEPELTEALGDRYRLIDSYALRPGVTLLLYARGDLIERSF